MAIKLTCSCGKRLRTKDENAGKRLKCPACRSIVLIPGARTANSTHVPPDSLNSDLQPLS
jgi:DNA-directed RNA polymerase subunit RPC12/RpoP